VGPGELFDRHQATEVRIVARLRESLPELRLAVVVEK
jgi:hypothetical protein